MNSALKQRLVGAIVLVALAVIFLPMLLDGSGNSDPVSVVIEIPEEADPPENRLDEPAMELEGNGEARAGDDNAGEAGEGESSEGGLPLDEGEAGDVALKDADRSGQDADRNGDDDTGRASGSNESEGESGNGDGDADEGWAVQVGSFSRETNALVLRDQLREAGFDAFARQSGSNGDAIWRVRVGPVPTRDEAESLGQRVEDERGESVLVVSHP